jgi:diguanylate cyclase (GGDEF)-like protein
MNQAKKYPIKKMVCAFQDKKLEQEYLEEILKTDKKYMKPLILIVSLVYLLFTIPEYIFLKDNVEITNVFIIRIITFLVIFCLYLMMSKEIDFKKMSLYVSFAEIILALSYFFVLYKLGSVEYFITLLDMIVLISVVFLLPNIFINKIIVTIIISVFYFINVRLFYHNIEFGHYMAGIIYSTIIFLIFIITFHKINYYDRVRFLNERELKILSETDSLTGINNRAKFDKELIRWIKYKERYNSNVSIILMDFDKFKRINDIYGHLEGDRILKEGVEIIKELIRETDIFARWGGEEFVLLLPETDRSKAIIIADRIREKINIYDFNIDEDVTCSFGVTEVFEGDNIHNVFDRVDELLYVAKKKGRNTVVS